MFEIGYRVIGVPVNNPKDVSFDIFSTVSDLFTNPCLY